MRGLSFGKGKRKWQAIVEKHTRRAKFGKHRKERWSILEAVQNQGFSRKKHTHKCVVVLFEYTRRATFGENQISTSR